MKGLIKRFLQLVFGDYSIYHIYSCTRNSAVCAANSSDLRFTAISESDVQDSSDELIRDQTWYHGPDTYAYGCIEKSRIVGVCYVWYGERYRARNYWPLSDDEAKIVQLITIPEMRGRGIGTDLIAYSANDILQKGFRRIYSRVWHSNLPSCRAMRSAGWERIATVVELHPLNHRKAVRMTLGAAPEKRLTSRLGDSDGPMHERSTPNSSALKTGRGQKDKDSL